MDWKKEGFTTFDLGLRGRESVVLRNAMAGLNGV